MKAKQGRPRQQWLILLPLDGEAMSIWNSLFGKRATALESGVQGLHRHIIETATKKLGRSLSPQEMHFITSRSGYIALEMISDTVDAADADEILRYLNSEKKI